MPASRGGMRRAQLCSDRKEVLLLWIAVFGMDGCKTGLLTRVLSFLLATRPGGLILSRFVQVQSCQVCITRQQPKTFGFLWFRAQCLISFPRKLRRSLPTGYERTN